MILSLSLFLLFSLATKKVPWSSRMLLVYPFLCYTVSRVEGATFPIYSCENVPCCSLTSFPSEYQPHPLVTKKHPAQDTSCIRLFGHIRVRSRAISLISPCSLSISLSHFFLSSPRLPAVLPVVEQTMQISD